MAFTRKFLTDHGVPEDQVDAIMAERNRTLTDYVPKTDVQSQIDAAVATARTEAAQQVNVEESDAYKALQAELNKTRAIGSEDFSTVKPKFREAVYGLLDHESPLPTSCPPSRNSTKSISTPANLPSRSRESPSSSPLTRAAGCPRAVTRPTWALCGGSRRRNERSMNYAF